MAVKYHTKQNKICALINNMVLIHKQKENHKQLHYSNLFKYDKLRHFSEAHFWE